MIHVNGLGVPVPNNYTNRHTTHKLGIKNREGTKLKHEEIPVPTNYTNRHTTHKLGTKNSEGTKLNMRKTL